MTKFSPNTQVDFVVVGSGVSGGIMAKELTAAGFQVVILEQGDYLREKDFEYDQLKRTSHSSLLSDEANPVTFRQTASEKATLSNGFRYGRCVGGGTVHYSGSSWRHHESDFHERSLLGPVSGSGFDDWPVTYAELAAAGHPRYWDPASASPWTSYQDPSGQWHLAYYEDPQSIAMKVESPSTF